MPAPSCSLNALDSRNSVLVLFRKTQAQRLVHPGCWPMPIQALGGGGLSQLADDPAHADQASKDAWVKKGWRLRFPQKSRVSLRQGNQISPGSGLYRLLGEAGPRPSSPCISCICGMGWLRGLELHAGHSSDIWFPGTSGGGVEGGGLKLVPNPSR